jgi:hypothetical protein
MTSKSFNGHDNVPTKKFKENKKMKWINTCIYRILTDTGIMKD